MRHVVDVFCNVVNVMVVWGDGWWCYVSLQGVAGVWNLFWVVSGGIWYR